MQAADDKATHLIFQIIRASRLRQTWKAFLHHLRH